MKIFQEPRRDPMGQAGADFAVESTTVFTKRKKVAAHLKVCLFFFIQL